MMRGIRTSDDGAGTTGCGFLTAGELGRFIDGALDATRNEAFDGHQLQGCSDCALLAADVAAFQGVLEGGVLASEQREFDRTKAIVKAELRQKLETMEFGAGPQVSSWFRWMPALGAAAAMLMLAVTLAPRIDRLGAPDGLIALAGGDSLALQPFEYGDPVVTRDGGGSAELWRQAGEAYRDGRYADALAPLQTLTERDADSIDAHLYLGNALLMVERFEPARDALQRAESLAGRGSAATFGLAQARLGLGDSGGARADLQAVIEGGGLMAGPAAELLDRIAAD